MSQEHLIQICQQLAAAGKTPSVALVKSRVTQKVSMQAVIKAVQLWKQNPDIKLPKVEQATENSKALSLEHRVSQLEQEVAELKQALHSLVNETKQ